MKIAKKIKLSFTLLLLSFLLSFSLIFIFMSRNSLIVETKKSLQLQTQLLSDNLDNIKNNTKLLNESLFDGYNRSIRYATEITVSILKHHKNLADKKAITLLEAQNRAKDIIRDIRYNEGQGYFWIDDDKYTLLVHAILTDKEGMYRYDVKDPSGYYLMRSIVGKAVEEGHVYTDYQWPKPKKDPNKWFKKRSYSELFPGWNWIPGTGNYIDDIQADVSNYQDKVDQLVRENLQKLSEEGIAIVFDENTKIIRHPNSKYEGVLISNIFKQDSNSIEDNFYNNVGFIEFSAGEKEYIGYIHKNVTTGNKILVAKDKKNIFKHINIIRVSMILLSCLIILIGLIISIRLSNNISDPITTISQAIGKVSIEGLDKRIYESKANDEVHDLAVSFNKMMSDLQQSNKKIDDYQKNLEAKIAERTIAIKASNTQLQKKYDELEKTKIVIAKAEAELRKANQELERLTITDPLTGIANRLCFESKLKEAWSTQRRSKQPLSILMIDIDHFKLFNDHYGHPAGDQCLKKVAAILTSSLKRSSDLVARYGGEEFILILPGNDISSAINIADNIQSAIADARIEHLKNTVAKVLTVSIGISSVIPSDKSTIEAVVKQADIALYNAKKNGRNRFEVVKDKDEPAS